MANPERRKAALERKGRRALSDHAADCAAVARERYGNIDAADLPALLEDRKVVRFPTVLRFDATRLEPGEFAHTEPVGARPGEGYRLFVHPYFEPRPDDVLLLAAYHLVTINYGDVATANEAEVFGATLLGLSREAYYQRLCTLADELVAVTEERGATP